MSPKKTSTRHAKAKRAAKRSGRRARARRASKDGAAARGVELRATGLARGDGRGGSRSGSTSGGSRSGAKRGARAASAAAGPRKQDAPRPRLAVVARPAPKRAPKKPRRAAVTEFAGAKAGATPKDLALFGLERARVAVHAAIQGLTPGAAERPIAEGKWSPRQMVLHLAFWDREIMIKYLEAAAARNQRADIRRSRLEAMNRAGLATLEQHDWETARRLLQTTHEDLWDALDSIPAEPEDVWSPEHAVGELVREVTNHDRHHADVIKRWRAEAKV
jgi:hypothetical protein